MIKSFKGFLYQAFLELDGARGPVNTAQLAQRSRRLLEHRPDDMRNELPANLQTVSAASKAWLTYWRKNPIHFSCKQDKSSSQAWFIEQGDSFALNFNVEPHLQDAFASYFQELIDVRLAQYFARERKVKNQNKPYPVADAQLLQVAEDAKNQ